MRSLLIACVAILLFLVSTHAAEAHPRWHGSYRAYAPYTGGYGGYGYGWASPYTPSRWPSAYVPYGGYGYSPWYPGYSAGYYDAPYVSPYYSPYYGSGFGIGGRRGSLYLNCR